MAEVIVGHDGSWCFGTKMRTDSIWLWRGLQTQSKRLSDLGNG